ncbi:threonine/serine exporter family protein [Microlunatus ginsengisoli]|uniref:threonine/serine exporter family protein n=1 Tax=Microlunatus ginsengisoli TaxID=363863 RepID=UPI0031E0B41A
MKTRTRLTGPAVVRRLGTISAGLATVLGGLALLIALGSGLPASAHAPTPGEGGPTAASQSATDEPTEPTQTPTSPDATGTSTDEPTEKPTGPMTSAIRPTEPSTPTPTPTATPSRATPTPKPSASTTTATVQRPATPPASADSDVPVWSVIIALAVLAFAVPILVALGRAAPESSESDTTIRPDADGEALALMSEAGEAMIDSGYDVVSVQAAMDDIAFANGLRHAESIALPTVIMVSARVRGQVRTSVVATGTQSLRLHQIEEIDDVVTAARRGLATTKEGIDRIAKIRAMPPPYPPPVQLVGQILTSAALAVLLGGSLLGIGIAALLGSFVGALGLAGARLPARYQVLVTVTAAFVVGLSVFLLSRTNLDFGVLPCLIAPLALLLPGAQLTTSMIELATNQMISGAGRLAAGAMQLVLLALGIVAAAALVGIPTLDLSRAYSPLGPIGPWIAVAVFGLGVVLNRAARARSLGWILLVLYVAYGAQVLGNLFFGGVLSAFVGAAAMTPVAALVARQRTGPPAMVSFTPAFWLLVPGALGLVGVTTILDGDSSGLTTVLTTASTMIAIALGVLVGWAITGVFRRIRERRRMMVPP